MEVRREEGRCTDKKEDTEDSTLPTFLSEQSKKIAAIDENIMGFKVKKDEWGRRTEGTWSACGSKWGQVNVEPLSYTK